MRVPVKSPKNSQSQSPKRVSSSNNINSGNAIARNISFHTHSDTSNSNKCYEPTSVLDPRRSPSPVPATEVSAISDPPTDWEEHVLRNMDWDSVMKDLGVDDDSVPPIKVYDSPLTPSSTEPQIPHQLTDHFNQQLDSIQLLQYDFNFNVPDSFSSHGNQSFVSNFPDVSNNLVNSSVNMNLGFEFDFIEELIRAADCFDSNDLQLAQMILARLNQRLRAPSGKPLQRAAFFFKEALNSLLNGLTRPTRLSSWPEIIQSVRAHKAFSAISPIPMFTHFTTTQALLESLDGSPPLIHIIDFDIGFGGQYASFMREIAERAHTCTANKIMNPTSLRITAVVSDEYVTETRLIKDNLVQFAQELRIRFHVEFVLVRTFEMLSFKAVKFMDGEKVAVVLSPTIFRRLGNSTNNAIAFVADLQRISPSVVVFTDNEAWAECGGTAPFFRRNLVNSLEYYTMVFDSLDAAAMDGGGDWGRKIETFLLRPRITAAVEVAGRRMAPWREVVAGAGMRPVQLSQFAGFLAECLLAKVQVSGFHVAKRQAELVLCWHQWTLVSTSAWRC